MHLLDPNGWRDPDPSEDWLLGGLAAVVLLAFAMGVHNNGRVAQRLEPTVHNSPVAGSSPALSTTFVERWPR